MQITNIHEAKTHLSKYIELAYEGEEVIICKSGKPMVKLVRYQEIKADRKPGYWKGKVVLSEDFDALPSSFLNILHGDEHPGDENS